MLNEEEFKNIQLSSYDLETGILEFKQGLREMYDEVIEVLKKYSDLEDRYYPVIALWIIGTYAHDSFETYPYLFLNASKGSGKSRLLRLISHLSKNGKLLGSMTESALFRGSKGCTLCIDEFENPGADGKSALRELLNSAYKRGLCIERFRKKKTIDGETYEIETFDVYTSIAMANISGMEKVLADRCITLILEKSTNLKITRLIEDFNNDYAIKEIKKQMVTLQKKLANYIEYSNLSKDWNDHVLGILRDNTENKDLLSFFEEIDNTEIEGRNLELLLPLYFIAYLIDDESATLKRIIQISKEIIREKEAEEDAENSDRILLKFLKERIFSNNLEYLDYISTTKITNEFKDYLGDSNEWVNSKWVGISLRRMKLIKSKKRESKGIKILLDLDNQKLK